MERIVRQLTGALGLLFMLALLSTSAGFAQPAIQAASAGCAGAHCLFVPLARVSGPVFVVSAGIDAYRVRCALSARAVVENISAVPLAELNIELDLIYTTGVTTTTLSLGSSVLLPGQRAEIYGPASCINGVYPQIGQARLISSTAAPDQAYAPLAVTAVNYNCSNYYAQSVTASIQNNSATPITDIKLFFDTATRFPAGNTFAVSETLVLGASYTLGYNVTFGYGDLGCTGSPTDPSVPRNPPPTTVYAYGRVVQ